MRFFVLAHGLGFFIQRIDLLLHKLNVVLQAGDQLSHRSGNIRTEDLLKEERREHAVHLRQLFLGREVHAPAFVAVHRAGEKADIRMVLGIFGDALIRGARHMPETRLDIAAVGNLAEIHL